MTLQSSAPGNYGRVRLVSGTLTFTSTTVALETLAAGDVVIQCWCDLVTAFNAVSTNVITVGDGTTGTKYLNATDVTEGTPGIYPTGGKGPFTAETAAGTLTATYAQTGTAATTGAAKVYALVTSLPE